jgi:hypothetical protein
VVINFVTLVLLAVVLSASPPTSSCFGHLNNLQDPPAKTVAEAHRRLRICFPTAYEEPNLPSKPQTR